MVWWGNDARADITKQMIGLFETKYPNITVVSDFADVAPYWQRITTQAAAGNAPDVIQIDTQNVPQYSSKGLLADLSKFPGQLDLSGYTDAQLAMGQTDKGQVAAPIGVLSPAIVINTSLVGPRCGKVQSAHIAAKFHQLGTVIRTDPGLIADIAVGLVHSPPQTSRRDPELLRDLLKRST